MQLKELASLLKVSSLIGEGNVELSGIQTDSRNVKLGDLFICLPGHTSDGHKFAAAAVRQGAAALVIEHEVDADVPKLLVKDCRYAMAVIANHFYGYPTDEMKVIGITGTNGKTTTTFLIDAILEDQRYRTGLMGTIVMKIGGVKHDFEGTTQEAVDLQRNFRRMRDVDTDYCIMEVSSHALVQGRVKGCNFRTAIFTNLTQDHLDYHHTMEEYKAAKGLFFSRLGNTFSPDPKGQKFAILNKDDSASEEFAKLTTAQVITYGINNPADITASNIELTSGGTQFDVATFNGDTKIKLQMLGKFNVYNALAAIAAALAEQIPLADIKRSLEAIKGVDGRVEGVRAGQEFTVLVDYAHTPDGLENVLSAVKEFAEGKIYCVFGCGGDRDRTKRPIMGGIAAKYSDYVFVTSDNPRSEDPEAILQDIEPGIISAGYRPDQYELIADRRAAIQKAMASADSKDVVLIAGKGHEPYQLIQGIYHDFDDRIEAIKALEKIGYARNAE